MKPPMRVWFASEADRAALLARTSEFHDQVRRAVSGLEHREALDQADIARLEVRLTDAACRVAPGLRVEVQKARPSGHELVVLPDSGEGLECVAAEMVRFAPVLPGVTFQRHGRALPLELALDDVRARTGFDLSFARARVGFSRGHLLEVVLHSHRFASTADEGALGAADLLVSRLIGDLHYHEWIGAVDVAPAPRGGPLRVVTESADVASTLTLAELAPAVQRAIEQVDEALPAERYHERKQREGWTMLDCFPEMQTDYSLADDLAMASTLVPEALKCFLQGSRFSSRRFSRHGERLVYVKIDAASSTPEQRHALGVAVEDAIDAALVPLRAGCAVGAGIGLRYVYVFVMLEGLEHCRALSDALRPLKVDPRSWILFCDIGWEHEWIGLCESTPTPP